VDEAVVLNASEGSRVDYAAHILGLPRAELRVKVCQLKSFLASRSEDLQKIRASVAANVAGDFSDVLSFCKLIAGITGIVAIAHASATAAGITLFVIGAVLLFVGAMELKRLVKPLWDRLMEDLSSFKLA
jgi:predicted lysophospholipase L1 biosynthesis ABC-type transport system permease subunit